MTDIILEGVRASEIASLAALDRGQVGISPDELRRLTLKGWVEQLAEQPLITLTGRALLERARRLN